MLRLLSADKAGLFGLDARDQRADEAIDELVGQGCTPEDARDRLANAIAAGAFVRADSPQEEGTFEEHNT